MARTLKIIQAASDQEMSYAALLKDAIEPIHRGFADRHGYAYELDTTRSFHPYWMKAYMMLAAIDEGFERVVWLDADAIWLGDEFDLEFPTVFGMTRHDGFGEHESHFNAGVIYVNNLPETKEVVARWFEFRRESQNDQPPLNKHFREHITQIDHQWNSTSWITYYRSTNPKVIAWHGCPNRIEKMRAFIQENGF